MKKVIKRVLGAIGALLLLGVLAMVVKFYVLSPKMRPAPDVKAPTSPEALARGKYLVDHVTGCLGCHSKVDLLTPGEPVVDGFLGAGRDFGAPPGFRGTRARRTSARIRRTGSASGRTARSFARCARA